MILKILLKIIYLIIINTIQINLIFILYYQGFDKSIKNNIIELYEIKDYKFINEMSDNEAYNYILHNYKLCYDKEYVIKFTNNKKVIQLIYM